MAHLHIKDTVISERRLPLPGRVVVLGRSLDVDVPVPHVSVSRRHALIEVTDSGFLLSDLGSSNGTFVNGVRLDEGERHELSYGEPFRVGEVRFSVAADEAVSAPPPVPVKAAAAAPASTPTPAPAPPVVSVTATSKVRPSAAGGKPKSRSKPSTGLRATKRRERDMAMKWMGVLITVGLVGLAVVFLVKIVAMSGDENGGNGGASATEGATEGATEKAPEKADEKKWEVVPLKRPGEK